MRNSRMRTLTEKMSEEDIQWCTNKEKVIKFLVEFINNPGIITEQDTHLFNKLAIDFKRSLNIEGNVKYINCVYDSFDYFICVPYEEFDNEVYIFMLFRVSEILCNKIQDQHLYLLITDNHGTIYYLNDIECIYNSIKESHKNESYVILDFFTL